MSIKGWTDHDYEIAKARHLRLQAELKKRYAGSYWGAISDMKNAMESLGADLARYEQRLVRLKERKP